MILLYTTLPTKEEAEDLVRTLLNEKLIVCANMHSASSMYLWQSTIEHSSEIITLLKTSKEKQEKTIKRIKELHSYEVPCIFSTSVEVNKAYQKYLEKEIK